MSNQPRQRPEGSVEMGCGGEGSSHQFGLGPKGLGVTLYRGQWGFEWGRV